MTKDRVLIRNLLLRGIIGVNDWEREVRQDILVNIELTTDMRAAGRSDDIQDAVNYRTVTKRVIEHVEASGRFTVEALATDIARLCLAEDGVGSARIRVEKPGALRFAESVGVEILRDRADFD